MKSLVRYLQKHLDGEVLVGDDVLETFSRDASPLVRRPQAVVYARHGRDVRRCLLFLSQLAAKGSLIPLTVRGGGSDLSGAAIGSGVILVMPAYMNRLLRGDVRRAIYRAEAGLEAGELRGLLADAGLYLPPLASLPPTATLGGSVANDASSRYSGKYGRLNSALRSLKVVLANGEEIEAGGLSRQAVKQKMTLASFEGDIYRSLSLLFLNDDAPFKPDGDGVLGRSGLTASELPAYNLEGVLRPDGGLNLAPLFAGSQGTLGVITEVEFAARSLPGRSRAVILVCDRPQDCFQAAEKIRELEPAALNFISSDCFRLLRRLAPFLLEDFPGPATGVVLIAEFDDRGRRLSKNIRQAEKIAGEAGLKAVSLKTDEDLKSLERIRTSLGLIPGSDNGPLRHIWSGFRAAWLPPENLPAFFAEARPLFENYKLDFLVFGDLSSGQISALPRFSLQTRHHRQRFLKFLDLYQELVSTFGGRASLERQEGALLGQLLKEAAGEAFELLEEIKRTFDPHGILNPDIKVGARPEAVAKDLAAGPSWAAFYGRGPQLL